jgi:hypothetical protein
MAQPIRCQNHEETAAAVMFTTLSDGDTVSLCWDCLPAFLRTVLASLETAQSAATAEAVSDTPDDADAPQGPAEGRYGVFIQGEDNPVLVYPTQLAAINAAEAQVTLHEESGQDLLVAVIDHNGETVWTNEPAPAAPAAGDPAPAETPPTTDGEPVTD